MNSQYPGTFESARIEDGATGLGDGPTGLCSDIWLKRYIESYFVLNEKDGLESILIILFECEPDQEF